MLTKNKKEGFVTGTIKDSTEQKDITFSCVDSKPTDQRLTCTYTGLSGAPFTIPRPVVVENKIALNEIIYVDNIDDRDLLKKTLDINIDFSKLSGNMGSMQFKLIGVKVTKIIDQVDNSYKLGKLISQGSTTNMRSKNAFIFAKAYVPAFNINENKIIAKIKVEYTNITEPVILDPNFNSFIAEPNTGRKIYISQYGKVN